MSYRKCLFNKNQDCGRRFLEFRKMHFSNLNKLQSFQLLSDKLIMPRVLRKFYQWSMVYEDFNGIPMKYFTQNMLLVSITGLLVRKWQILSWKIIVDWNVVHIGRIAEIKLQKWFTKNIHIKLKWTVVVWNKKKTRWPTCRRLFDACV